MVYCLPILLRRQYDSVQKLSAYQYSQERLCSWQTTIEMPCLSLYVCCRRWATQARDWIEKSVKCDLILPGEVFIWFSCKALWRITHDPLLLDTWSCSKNGRAYYCWGYSWNWFRWNVAFSASITASATFGHSASPDNVTCWHTMVLQWALKVFVKRFKNSN